MVSRAPPPANPNYVVESIGADSAMVSNHPPPPAFSAGSVLSVLSASGPPGGAGAVYFESGRAWDPTKLYVKLEEKGARAPVRASPGAAGYDLFALKDCVVPQMATTGVHIHLCKDIDEMVKNLCNPDGSAKKDVPKQTERDAKAGKLLVPTGISVAIPPGYYGRIAPRSGLALKNSIDVGAGVIDGDYRGKVGVILFNFDDQPFVISAGDRIAQLILEKYAEAPVEVVDTLPPTTRGSGGFGSTGR